MLSSTLLALTLSFSHPADSIDKKTRKTIEPIIIVTSNRMKYVGNGTIEIDFIQTEDVSDEVITIIVNDKVQPRNVHTGPMRKGERFRTKVRIF